MNAVQSETAFRSRPLVRGGALPAPSGALPASPRKPADAARRSRATQRPQDLWLAMMVVAAFVCSTAGLLYLSSYARLTREGYRRDHLLRQLHAAQEQSRQLQQIKAMLSAPDTIEKKARAMNMVPADDSQ